MSLNDEEITQRLAELARVEPRPETTGRAIARARAAFTRNPSSTSRRAFNVLRLGGGIAAAVAFIGLIIWLMTNGTSVGLAFGDVRARVEKTRSITCKATLQCEGQPAEITRLWLLENGLSRIEMPGGDYNVTDAKQRKSLTVNHRKKKAMLIQGAGPQLTHDIYRLIRTAPEKAVNKLPPKEIKGKKLAGFVVPISDDVYEVKLEMTVWVDPKTRLPARFEVKDKDEKGRRVEYIIDGIVYDQKLDEALFSLKPPDGYELQTLGVAELQPAPKEKDLLAPEAKPGVGLGPVRFGMSKEEVIKLLGQPDKIEQGGQSLSYLSRGYGILVRPSRGVAWISCFTQKTFAVKVRDYAGKTTEGIGMGSSRKEIEKAYGPPDQVEVRDGSMTDMYYTKKGLEFMLAYDKLVMFSLHPVHKKK